MHFFMTMEKSCQVQLAAEAAAAGTGRKPIEIPAAEAAAVYKVTGSNYGGWFSGRPHFELLEHLEGEKFDFERGEVVKVAKP